MELTNNRPRDLHDGGLPRGWRKRLVDLGILLFLTLQIVIPTSYYLFTTVPTMERFSWRMFSSVDLSSWNTTVIEQRAAGYGRDADINSPIALNLPDTANDQLVEINLDGAVQSSTARSIRRCELDVVEKFLKTRASNPHVVAVTYTAVGTAPSGAGLGDFQMTVPGGSPRAMSPTTLPPNGRVVQ